MDVIKQDVFTYAIGVRIFTIIFYTTMVALDIITNLFGAQIF